MIGTRLGSYRIRELVGTGGMGEVYRATDERLHREVAIKILPAGTPGDDGARARLEREAITLSQLNHPHIAALYSIGTEADRDYLVLEYVSGGTLADLLSQGPLPLDRIVAIGVEIAEGLEAAHEIDIVHRDLKPANIALDPRSHVKILDFGIAGFLAERGLVPTGVTPTLGLGPVGTLPYMAPEQFRAEPVDARTDLRALGVLLYEMATGKQLYAGDNSAVIIEAILHSSPPRLRSVQAGLPAALEAIVSRLLEKRQGDRYASASEVLSDLRQLAHDPQARPAHVLRRTQLRAGIALGAVMLAAFAVFILRERFAAPTEGRDPNTTSIVVFPLEVLGGEEGSTYLGRAFAEALTVNLAQAAGLEVVPVPAAAPATGDGASGLIRSARRLGADRAVSGSLLRQKGALHATIQLVDARRNRVAWGSRYEIDPSDVGRSASDLAREITSQLGVSSQRMYEYFRYEGGTPEMAGWSGLPETIAALRRHDVPRGLALTESLLVRFPRVPEAHVMRLVALVDQDNMYQGTHGARQAVIRGVEALEKVDPKHPNVQVLGSVYWEKDADLVLSQVLARTDLRPGLRSHALRYRARARIQINRDSDGAADMEEAIRQDPANPYNYIFMAQFLSSAGRHEEALQRAREAAAIDPAFGKDALVGYLEGAGQFEAAMRHAEKILKEDPRGGLWARLARLQTEHGRPRQARVSIARARAFPQNGLTEYSISGTYSLLGESREALASLERAVQLGFRSTTLHEDSAYVGLWRDPRFLRIVENARPDSTDIPAR